MKHCKNASRFCILSLHVRAREPLNVFLWNLVLRGVTGFCRLIQIADNTRTPVGGGDTLHKKLQVLLGVYF